MFVKDNLGLFFYISLNLTVQNLLHRCSKSGSVIDYEVLKP